MSSVLHLAALMAVEKVALKVASMVGPWVVERAAVRVDWLVVERAVKRVVVMAYC